MAVYSVAVFNISPVITNHSVVYRFVYTASSCGLKLAEGCRGWSGATNVASTNLLGKESQDLAGHPFQVSLIVVCLSVYLNSILTFLVWRISEVLNSIVKNPVRHVHL